MKFVLRRTTRVGAAPFDSIFNELYQSLNHEVLPSNIFQQESWPAHIRRRVTPKCPSQSDSPEGAAHNPLAARAIYAASRRG
jgi:hypothetical protein